MAGVLYLYIGLTSLCLYSSTGSFPLQDGEIPKNLPSFLWISQKYVVIINNLLTIITGFAILNMLGVTMRWRPSAFPWGKVDFCEAKRRMRVNIISSLQQSTIYTIVARIPHQSRCARQLVFKVCLPPASITIERFAALCNTPGGSHLSQFSTDLYGYAEYFSKKVLTFS